MNNEFVIPSVTVSNSIQNKGNPARVNWRRERNWKPYQLFQHVNLGFPFAVGNYSNNQRRGSGFISGQLIGLDFDNLTPELAHKLLEEEFVKQYASFSYTTPRHKSEQPRIRLVFVLEKPIEGKELYEWDVSKLLAAFAAYNPDNACKDAARMFYGNSKTDLIFTRWIGQLLPGSVLDQIPAQVRLGQAESREVELPRAFIDALERSLRLTGKKHGEFLECHCPIHPPDESCSAAWHPWKHFLWCYHESTHYLAKDVGEQLGVYLSDYTATRKPAVINEASNKFELAISDEISPLMLSDKFEQLNADLVADFAVQNEYGDARLLLHLVGNRLACDKPQNQWYWWGGHFWRKDGKGKTPELLFAPTGEQYANAAGEYTARLAKLEAQLETRNDDPVLQAEVNRIKTIAKDLASRPRALRTNTRAKNVLNIASGLCALEGTEWDRDPLLLGVQNGVIDLRTGNLQPGKLKDYIRKVARVPYKPEAQAPRWKQFILEILDGDLEFAEFLQRLFGYFVTGLVSEHTLALFYGRGRNGKDTLIEIIAYVLGAYASAGTGDLLIDSFASGQATPHLFDLQGRRLVWVTETSEGAKLNVNQVKYLTGAGRINARPLYGNPIEFEATHHIILFTNHKPRVPSQTEDYAIWKRLLLIPLTLSFVDNPKAEHERIRDPYLKQKLLEEGEGILNWLVQGCLQWQTEGLNPPQSILQATEDYARSEDIVGLFLEDCCEFLPLAREHARPIYEAFQAWARSTGFPELGMRKFGERLSSQFAKERTSVGIVYIGLRLRQSS